MRRLSPRRLSIRTRLAALFALGFFSMGLAVRGIILFTLRERLTVEVPEPPSELGLDPDRVAAVTRLIQTAQDEFRSQTLRELFVVSGLTVAIGALLASALGWWLAGRALRPVETITRAAQGITARSLDTRVGYEGPADEVAELAATIDGMLDRIESGGAAQRQFAAMASHELKTPLAVIQLEADMAEQDPSSTTVEELAGRTGAASARATKLVNQLLELSRSQVGVQDVDRVDLADVTTDAIDRIADRFASSELTAEHSSHSGFVLGDRTLLDSLLDNLLSNAVKHNHDYGFVTVEVSPQNDQVRLVVENSGAELDDSTLARISEPFQRGVENPDSLGHGTGMTIIRTIVERHDGQIEVHTRRKGGLRIEINLPRV